MISIPAVVVANLEVVASYQWCGQNEWHSMRKRLGGWYGWLYDLAIPQMSGDVREKV